MLMEHQLFESLWNDGLWGLAIVDRSGQFIRANDAFCALLEYSEPELRTMRFEQVTHPGDIDVDRLLAEITAKGARDSYTMKKRYLTKRGEVVWALLHVKAIKTNEEFRFFLSQVSGLGSVHPADRTDGGVATKWLLMAFIRRYWPAIVTAVGFTAWIFAEALKRLGVFT